MSWNEWFVYGLQWEECEVRRYRGNLSGPRRRSRLWPRPMAGGAATHGTSRDAAIPSLLKQILLGKIFSLAVEDCSWLLCQPCLIFLPSPSPIFQTLVIHLFVSFSSNIYSRVLNSLTFRPINNYWNKSFIFQVSTTSYISPFITQSLYSLPIQLVVLVFVIGLPVGEMRTRSLLPNHQPTGRDKS